MSYISLRRSLRMVIQLSLKIVKIHAMARALLQERWNGHSMKDSSGTAEGTN